MRSVSVNENSANNISNERVLCFKGNSKYTGNSVVDSFIRTVNDENERLKNGRSFSKYFWSQTAGWAALLPILGYETAVIVKGKKLEKAGKTAEVKQLAKKFLKNLTWLTPASIALFFGVQYLIGQNTDKKFEKVKEQFNKLNTETSAALDDETFNSGYIAGIYYSGSNKIKVNRNFVNDPLSRLQLKKILKHELIHAKQSELIARSEDGIKKLNYATMQKIAQRIKQQPDAPEGIEQLYNEFLNDNGQLDDYEFQLYSINFKLKNFIEALHILINNDKATYNDIPICIDEEHYKKVIEKDGALTPDEEAKAQEYYDAMLSYTAPKGFLDAYNPFGSYRKNGLEKEAYKG